MANGTSPSGTSADDSSLSFNEGVNDISNLLGGLDDDVLNPTDDEDQASETDDEGDLDAAPDEDQPEEDEADDDDLAEGLSTRQSDPSGGKFVPDTGKVTMEDGTVLTVADLKRNNLYQRDYTAKTTEFKAEKEQFSRDREFVGQHAQAVARERQVLAEYVQMYLPQPPDAAMAREDPIGYNIAKAEYDEKAEVLNQIYHANQASAQMAAEQYQTELAEIKKAEAGKLFEKMPHLRDRQKFEAWFAEAGQLMVDQYGFTPEEVNEATDNRFYFMMDRLLRLDRALKKGKQVQTGKRQPGQFQKPRLLAGSNKNTPSGGSQDRQRQVLSERHKKLGTMESGVAKLRMFNL